MNSYGATSREVLVKVRIPHALPFLFSAFKVGTTLSVITASLASTSAVCEATLRGLYLPASGTLPLRRSLGRHPGGVVLPAS